MSFQSKKNDAISKIATVGGIDGTTDPVTFNVTTGEGTKFPASNFTISIGAEILLCTSRTGDALTCTRAQEGTTKASHTQGTDVEHRITAGSFVEFENIFAKTASTSGADDLLVAEQATAPTNPATGYRKMYPKADGVWYGLDKDGNEVSLIPTKSTKTLTAAGADDTTYLTPLDASIYGNMSMSRQAIINGNFDVWQRGTSGTTFTDSTALFLADHWYDIADDDGGTKPTITRSRQILTSGDISNAFYYSRLTMNGTGTSLGANSYHNFIQKVEHGTRLLCGDGKKVTVSFWARSDISNKRICPVLRQNYGTGGSPSAAEVIQGTEITLTNTWTKYTATFTTNTLASKTFGTANDDYLGLFIYYQWGATWADTYIKTGLSAETYGNGYIDIAQVQLCAGDVALPFQPKRFEEELRACQRYFNRIVSGAKPLACGFLNTTTNGRFSVYLPVTMRTTATLSTSTITGANFRVLSANAFLNVSAIADAGSNPQNFNFSITTAAGTANAGLQFECNDASGFIDLSAEL